MKLPRKIVLISTMTAGLSMAGSSMTMAQPPSTQPNIIFILTDDQGAESIDGPDVGNDDIWGNEMDVDSPTMKRLSEIGVSFTNCRVNPNCSPTRAGLMTGRRALSTGVTGVIAHYDVEGEESINPCGRDEEDELHGKLAAGADSLSLLTHERTIAEALQAAGRMPENPTKTA